MPSNRKFGGLFTLIFAVLAGLWWWRGHPLSAGVAAGACAAFGLVTLAAPAVLKPLNGLWFQLSLLLGRIVSPIVLSLIFLVLITPVAVISRLFGRDELQLKKRSRDSFWTLRNPAGPEPESFRHPF